jgi:hypothetical protein
MSESKCSVCGGVGWTDDPSKTHLGHWSARDLLRYPSVRAQHFVPEGTPPLPCSRCNKTERDYGLANRSSWLPYYPRWERDAVSNDGDRTSSVEWKQDPRARLLSFNGRPVRVTEDGTLTRSLTKKAGTP